MNKRLLNVNMNEWVVALYSPNRIHLNRVLFQDLLTAEQFGGVPAKPHHMLPDLLVFLSTGTLC